MHKLLIAALFAATVAGGAGAALAAKLTYKLPENTTAFKPGPGVDAAINNCGACHSADYVSSQAPRQGEAFWQAEVQKMIKIYGAQIDPAGVKAIADYLAKNY